MIDKTNGAAQQEFTIQRVYVKDLSFEAPNNPHIFGEEWKPQIDLELNNNGEPLGNDMYEVTLKINVTAKIGEKVAFIVELVQAGTFLIKNFDKEQIRSILGSYCPTILYPYAREAICNAIVRGGFPQLNLAPVNFEALYQQYEKQITEKASANSETRQ